ncbi:MAG: beta-aspartyl-peptidase [bacterium]|nr:beta-aspartyl-peptidase [bacterium]
MLTIIRGGTVLAPELLGVKDVLVAGERIAAISDPGTIGITGVDVGEIDAEGAWVLPGLVDSHVHLLGGGGEGGPATRVPEIRVEEIVAQGVTTVIGCLGTDGVTRHMSSLLAKARGLDAEGISAFVFVGSYELPVQTITGSVRTDLVLIDKVLGAGEIAISDHRSSQPTFEQLAQLAAECRVGGMLGGKAGILHLHLGDGSGRLELVFRILRETEIPSSQIVPTHCNRNPELLKQALRFAAKGGCIDLTAGLGGHDGGLSVQDSVRRALVHGVAMDRITVSSDANGSLPEFDDEGNLVRLGVGSQDTLLDSLRSLVKGELLELGQASSLYCENPARVYGLDRKGRLKVGSDADVLVLDSELEVKHVLARGRQAVRDGEVVLRGTFSSASEGDCA